MLPAVELGGVHTWPIDTLAGVVRAYKAVTKFVGIAAASYSEVSHAQATNSR